LLLLNLTIALAVVAAGAKIREEWLIYKERKEGLKWQAADVKPKTPAPTAAAAPSAAPAVTPANYIDVAQRVLFFRDRNSQVIVEQPVKVVKPLPPLPILLGTMNIGDGPTLIMAEKPNARPKGIHVGETIGSFKLAALESDSLVLEWEEGTVRKRFDELVAKPASGGESGSSSAASAGEQSRTGVVNPAIPAPAAQAPKTAAPAATSSGPGAEVGSGLRACVAGDTSPAGTVVDGMRKVVSATPFGNSCRWETAR
jgi:hypothetical protein